MPWILAAPKKFGANFCIKTQSYIVTWQRTNNCPYCFGFSLRHCNSWHYGANICIKTRNIITLNFFYLFALKVSGVRWVAPARLYSVSGLTKDAVESRVLTVCKAFDKITADKVNSCIFDLASIWQFFLPKVFIFNLVLWQSNLTNFLTKKYLFWI